MPIIELQQRLAEVGRIRMGDSVNGPTKLENFRLTSRDRRLLEAAAALYGGEVKPWTSPKAEKGQFELYTAVNEIPIVVSPIPITQWYELWSAGGCQRRCDGCTEMIKDTPCLCTPENRECKMTTRFSAWLPELPSVGVWRLEPHGYYAAVELPLSIEFLRRQSELGQYTPARLAIEFRTAKRNINGKLTTLRYPVPVIRIEQKLMEVLPMVGRTLTTGEPPVLVTSPAILIANIEEVDPRKVRAMELLRKRGWLTSEHEPTLLEFKEVCRKADEDWIEVLLDGESYGKTEWQELFSYTEEIADSKSGQGSLIGETI